VAALDETTVDVATLGWRHCSKLLSTWHY